MNWKGLFGSRPKQAVFEPGAVATSREEAALIRAALSDFTPDGPRRLYIDWLKARDKVEKADLVQATLTAYETGRADPLEPHHADNSWSRMMGAPLLRTLIERTADRSEFDRLKVLILPHLEPALSLDYAPMVQEPPIGTSRLWGLPDLAPETDWPVLADCSKEFGGFDGLPPDYPCGFVGQFAWADFKGTVLGEDLPEEGGLSVFAFTEVHELGIMETVLRRWNPQADLKRRSAPQQLLDDVHGDGTNRPHPPHRIELSEVLSLPDATDGPFQGDLPGFSWSDPHYEIYAACRDACGENHHGFGGYLSGTSGGDPSPATDWRRLAVLRINPDVGVLHFALPSEDLTSGRLDNARYVWMDWDS